MSVTLVNRSGRCLALNLPHGHVCAAQACLCTPPREPRGRPVCRSITLPAGHSIAGLAEAVLAAPEVLAAVRRGDLLAETIAPKRPAEASGPPANDAPDKRSRRERGASP
jgi:hypothetical protein